MNSIQDVISGEKKLILLTKPFVIDDHVIYYIVIH